jgi:hypothetical protein
VVELVARDACGEQVRALILGKAVHVRTVAGFVVEGAGFGRDVDPAPLSQRVRHADACRSHRTQAAGSTLFGVGTTFR